MEHKSLQERCLQVIIEHLDQFCSIFNTTKDPKLKRNFEFLQRCYSNRILQGLSLSGVVKEDYFPLLINKYLRELNLGILDRVDPETIVRIIAEIGEGLLRISFRLYSNLPSDALADIFPHLKNVTVLIMINTCTDDALKNIAKYCPHLVELNIADSDITKQGLRRYLCQKNDRNEVSNLNLRRLYLDRTEVDYDIAQLILKSFPQLEELDAPCMPCALHEMHQRDIDLNNTANLRKNKLIRLDARMCAHLESSPELLKLYVLLCPDVKSLAVVVFNLDQLNTLTTFTKLGSVYLEADKCFPRPSANNFLNNRGAGLTVLKLNGFSISVEVLLNSCPRLEELDLDNILFQPVDETSKKELKFLKKIHLECLLCIDVATSKSISTLITSARKLEKICIAGCGHLTDEFKEALKYCCIHCPLRKICFYYSETDLPMLQSILLSSRLLKVLRVVAPLDSENVTPYDIQMLYNIASSLENKPDFHYDSESYLNYVSEEEFIGMFNPYEIFDYVYGDDDD